jgi:carbon-monoxide dehydrogenase medium subunit
LIVLGAICRIIGPQGERAVPVDQFCTGPGSNVLEQGELLVSIQLPPPPPNSGARYLRFIPRNEMDIAVVGAGARVDLSQDFQKISSARIALGAVAPTPILAREASHFLVGKVPSETVFDQASALARAEAHPITDMRGTIAYRRHLVGVLVKRALRGAVDRVEKNGGC